MSDILKINDAESMVDDALEIYERDGKFYLSVDNPWAGSTETGFGYTTSVTLSAQQARDLAAFILEKLPK